MRRLEHRFRRASGFRRRRSYSETVIFCVVPRELEGELFERMVEYYKDNPNVTVIVDRREGPDRRDVKTDAEQSERRTIRDRRRPRAAGTFLETDAPDG
jgi:hypothetical protein